MTTVSMNGTKELIERGAGVKRGRRLPEAEPRVGKGVGEAVVAPKAKAAPEPQTVTIPAMVIQHIDIELVGDSPLLVHAWSVKAKEMMLRKQMKIANSGKDAKDPYQDFVDSLYWISDKPDKVTQKDIDRGRFGLPTIAFKAAAVDACSFVDGMTKVSARGAFHIDGALTEIHGDKPRMHEAMVRIAMGTADIRYRGEFVNWSAKLRVRFNKRAISPEQLVNLFNIAGFAVGVGEHRPQRDGSLGMFHVKTG